MNNRTKLGLGIASILAAGAGAAGIAAAGGGDDNEEPISGSALERASAAALAETGEGSVTETEVGDEESYYEVEVALPGGEQVDVQLDRDFNVVGSETDGANEDESGSDD